MVIGIPMYITDQRNKSNFTEIEMKYIETKVHS